MPGRQAELPSFRPEVGRALPTRITISGLAWRPDAFSARKAGRPSNDGYAQEIELSSGGANSLRTGPDEHGRFGIFGGRFVAETLMPLILDLEQAYRAAQDDPEFLAEMADLRVHYAGRPAPLYFAERVTEHLGAARV